MKYLGISPAETTRRGIPLNKQLVILGSGGHARSLLALAKKSMNSKCEVGYLSLKNETTGPFKELRRFGTPDEAISQPQTFFALNGIGLSQTPERRWQIFRKTFGSDYIAENVISTLAFIEPGAKLGRGMQIFDHVSIQTECTVQDDVVLGTGVLLEHDVSVSRGAFIAPRATLLGNSSVDEFATVGANATVLPGVRIGKNSCVGAGSLVRHDVPDGMTVVGVPATGIARS